MGVGFIDTSNSVIGTSHVDFYIEAVQFNGTLLCGPVAGRGTSCKSAVALRNGPLDPTDHIRVLIRSRFENRFAYQFERSSIVTDRGSYCRPIWPKRIVMK